MPDPKWSYEGAGKPIDEELQKKALVGFLAVIAVLCVIAGIVAMLYYGFLRKNLEFKDPPALPVATTGVQELPPEPRLQANPHADLRAMHAEEDSILTSYGWEEKSAQVARVPIEQAMKMVERDGVPSWPQPTQSTAPKGTEGASSQGGK
ncbi:MAG TPA: hypothetical protein VKA63_06925 [Candidatus Krumholzibacteria bacterium]|nr:hypothetical protein [Candidatus Krumholzibacteria bacterium]